MQTYLTVINGLEARNQLELGVLERRLTRRTGVVIFAERERFASSPCTGWQKLFR